MFQTLTRLIYPSLCMTCDDPLEDSGALCASCWKDAPFIHDPACAGCGLQLPGDGSDSGGVLCDGCIDHPNPWDKAASVFMYSGVARDLVLGLKHGDRHDLIRPFARWCIPRVNQMGLENPICVPVPLHWTRLAKRRFNQADLVAKDIAKLMRCGAVSDALIRKTRTASLDGKTRDDRFAELDAAIRTNPKRISDIQHKDVILVDDVMTSGATLTTCTLALREMGPNSISVLTLARVGKHP